MLSSDRLSSSQASADKNRGSTSGPPTQSQRSRPLSEIFGHIGLLLRTPSSPFYFSLSVQLTHRVSFVDLWTVCPSRLPTVSPPRYVGTASDRGPPIPFLPPPPIPFRPTSHAPRLPPCSGRTDFRGHMPVTRLSVRIVRFGWRQYLSCSPRPQRSLRSLSAKVLSSPNMLGSVSPCSGVLVRSCSAPGIGPRCELSCIAVACPRQVRVGTPCMLSRLTS